MIHYDVSLLVLRVGLAFMFLSAAIIHSKDAPGRWSARHFTSLLLAGQSIESSIVKVCGVIAIAILYISSIGVLLGVETKIAALLMFLFSACGFLIHVRDGGQAFQAATALEPSLPPDAVQVIGRVKFTAMVGSMSSAIKNVPVMAAALVLMIEGGGVYTLTHAFGLTSLW